MGQGEPERVEINRMISRGLGVIIIIIIFYIQNNNTTNTIQLQLLIQQLV